MGPFLQTFCNKVVSESLKSLIGVFHLVVLSVEGDTQLDVLNVFSVQYVSSYIELLDTEVGLQSCAHCMSTSLVNVTVVYFELPNSHVTLQEICNSLCTIVFKITVPEFEHFQRFVAAFEY